MVRDWQSQALLHLIMVSYIKKADDQYENRWNVSLNKDNFEYIQSLNFFIFFIIIFCFQSVLSILTFFYIDNLYIQNHL